MRLAEHFIAFLQQFNKFINTGAPMLDSVYHMALKLVGNHVFGLKTQRFNIYATLLWLSLHNVSKYVNH